MVRDSLFEKRFKDFIESIKSSHKKYVKNNKNINYSILYYTILYLYFEKSLNGCTQKPRFSLKCTL